MLRGPIEANGRTEKVNLFSRFDFNQIRVDELLRLAGARSSSADDSAVPVHRRSVPGPVHVLRADFIGIDQTGSVRLRSFVAAPQLTYNDDRKSTASARARTVAPKAPILPPSSVFEKHTPLPLKGGLHVATLHFRSHTTSLEDLTFFASFAQRAAKALGLPTSGIIALPTKTSLFTVPRSPFAHKKSQENFWRKEHKRAIKVFDGNEQVVEIWLAYLRKEAMGGVGMKAQIFRYRVRIITHSFANLESDICIFSQEVGYGQKMVTKDGLRESAILDDSAEVKAMADLIQAELATAVANEPEVEISTGPNVGEFTEILKVEQFESKLLEEVIGEEALAETDSVKVESTAEAVHAGPASPAAVEPISAESVPAAESTIEVAATEVVQEVAATEAVQEVVSPEAAVVEEAIVELVEEKLVELDAVAPSSSTEEVSAASGGAATVESAEAAQVEGVKASETKEEQVAKVIRKAAVKSAETVETSSESAAVTEEKEEAAPVEEKVEGSKSS